MNQTIIGDADLHWYYSNVFMMLIKNKMPSNILKNCGKPPKKKVINDNKKIFFEINKIY